MYKGYKYHSKDLNPSHRYILPKIEGILELYQPNKILDLGCGNGSVIAHLQEIGYDLYGIDSSTDGISFAREHHGLYNVKQFDLMKLDELDDNFIEADVYLCIEVVAHLYNPVEFFERLYSSMNKNAKIIITFPHHGYIKNSVIALSNSFDMHVRALWDGGYVKFFSKRSFTELCMLTGFNILGYHRVGLRYGLYRSDVVVLSKKL